MRNTYATYSHATKWYRNYSQELHVRKLHEIAQKGSPRIDCHEPASRKLLSSIKKGAGSQQQAIHQANLQFLMRLTEVSSKSSRQTAASDTVPTLASLNYPARKLESQRIAEENVGLLQRISKIPSSLSKQYFLRDFELSRKYLKLSSRQKQLQETRFKVGKASSSRGSKLGNSLPLKPSALRLKSRADNNNHSDE